MGDSSLRASAARTLGRRFDAIGVSLPPSQFAADPVDHSARTEAGDHSGRVTDGVGVSHPSSGPGSDGTAERPDQVRGEHHRVARRSRFDLAAPLLGLVLLLAAVLKAHGLAVGATAHGTASIWWHITLIEGEALLGAWLLSGYFGPWARGAAIVCFGALSCVAAYHVISGDDSCGCLGALRLNPWFALVFDALAVAVLVRFPPGLSQLRTDGRFALQNTTLGRVLLLSLVLMAAGYAASFALFGSPAAAVAWLHGSRVEIAPTVADLGDCKVGEERRYEFQITNHNSRPFAIVGGTTSCVCVATEGLPITVPPAQTRLVPVRIHIVGDGNEYRQRVTFYGDGHVLQVLNAEIRARIRR